jgi:hypothetical protein
MTEIPAMSDTFSIYGINKRGEKISGEIKVGIKVYRSLRV